MRCVEVRLNAYVAVGEVSEPPQHVIGAIASASTNGYNVVGVAAHDVGKGIQVSAVAIVDGAAQQQANVGPAVVKMSG